MHIVPSQVIVAVIAIVACIIVFSMVKKAIKWLFIVAILLIGGVAFGFLTPEQAINTANAIKNKGIATYEKLADASQNIKVDGESISIRIQDTWFDLNAVNSYEVNGDTVKISVGGNDYTVTDKTIAKLFNTITSN